MLLSLDRERGHIIAILRKGGGRKRFQGLLSFFDGILRRVFSFTGDRCSVEFGGKASVDFLSENSAPLFPGVLVTVSIHLVTPAAVLKLTSCPEFGIRSTRPFTATSIRKTEILFPCFL